MGNHEICCNINHGLIRCETPFTKEFNIEEEKYQNFRSISLIRAIPTQRLTLNPKAFLRH